MCIDDAKMKRRHISPNTRTFATLFVGLSRISNWDSYSNILARVHTAYTQLLAHFAALSVSNPTSPDIAPWPINGYLNLLSKTHDWPRIWDTFFGMQGRWKPDEVTYTLLLKALQARKSLSKAPNARGNEETEHIIDMKEWEAQYDLSSVPEEPSFETEIETGEPSLPLSISYQNASDARLVWEHLLRANKTDPQTAPINAHHLAPLIHLLAFGRPSDWELGWEVVERYLAVEHPLPKLRTKPRPKTEPAGEGAIAPGGRPVPVPLNQSLLTSLFNLSLQSGHTEYVIETFQSLASSPTKKQILNSSHLALVMYAFSLRRAPKGQVSDAREAIGVLEWILKEGDERARLRRRRIGDEGAGGDGPLLGWLKVSQKHFEYALVSAWKAVDFPAALRVFELITGLDRARFMTSIPTSAPSSDPSGPKRTRWKDRSSGSASASAPLKIKERHEGCKWDTEPMHLLVKTALATGRSNDLKVALRIFERLGIAHFFGPSENLEVLKGQKELASAVSRALKIVQRAAGDMRAEEPEKRMWERIGGAVGNLTKRLNKNVAEREEDELAERTKEKAKSMVEMKEENGKTVIQDEGVQLVVSLKGRKSEWSEGL